MKTIRIVTKQSLIIIGVALTALISYAQDPLAPPPEGEGHRPRGFHILPPHAEKQLNLTADQRKQLDELESEVKSKIETILTPDQLEKLKQMRPPKHKEGPEGGKLEGNQDGKPVCSPQTTGTH